MSHGVQGSVGNSQMFGLVVSLAYSVAWLALSFPCLLLARISQQSLRIGQSVSP